LHYAYHKWCKCTIKYVFSKHFALFSLLCFISLPIYLVIEFLPGFIGQGFRSQFFLEFLLLFSFSFVRFLVYNFGCWSFNDPFNRDIVSCHNCTLGSGCVNFVLSQQLQSVKFKIVFTFLIENSVFLFVYCNNFNIIYVFQDLLDLSLIFEAISNLRFYLFFLGIWNFLIKTITLVINFTIFK